MKKILVVEISGKRPGNVKQRPTENFNTCRDKVIISNNSEGYVTTWPIIDVPDDYRQWYIENVKSSDNAWYAPMNRSYAIKYAREHGYDYLVQLDDNIIELGIESLCTIDGTTVRRRIRNIDLLDDFITMFACVLDNTNAAMVGCNLAGLSVPQDKFLAERYCYSIFMLNLACCPDVFQGDFEDDIEYRLKCGQMNRPVVQIVCMRYGKTSQKLNKDLTGCRAEYLKQGLKRGEHMHKLYTSKYTAKMTNKSRSTRAQAVDQNVYFKHQLSTWKVGIIVYNKKAIDDCFLSIIRKYKTPVHNDCIIREKKKTTKRVKGVTPR